MKIRHGFPKVLAAIAQSALAQAISKGSRDKRVNADTPHGAQLRTRQDARREAHDLLAALARQESVAQFAHSRGWQPPAWCGSQFELNREASRWLDARWHGVLTRRKRGEIGGEA